MVWRITQNVSAERARQPHNFRSPRPLTSVCARGGVALSPTTGWLVAGVHPVAILYDIVVALPIWAAMLTSQFKRERTQPTGSCTAAVVTSINKTLAGLHGR